MCDARYKIYFNLTTISIVLAVVLLVIGVLLFRSNRIAKETYEQNSCEVIAASYYDSTCGGGGRFFGTYSCFIPVWMVNYSIVEGIRINATIESDGLKTTEDTQSRLDEYQIGMSYTCWCSIVDPSQATWKEPNTFAGMMLVIFGSIAAAMGLVGIYFTYTECKKIDFSKTTSQYN